MTALLCDSPVQAFARLTDPGVMGEIWRKQLPTLLGEPLEFTACNVQYARCRTYLNPASWHKSFLCVCYEFDVASNNTAHKPMLYGRAYLQGLSQAEYDALPPSHSALLIPELDMIAWKFPDDPRLPQLHELLDVSRVGKHFPYENLAFTEDAIVNVKIDVIVYRPEQRCILRYDISYGTEREHIVLYAKVFADDNGEHVFSRIQYCHDLAHTWGVRIARPLSYSAAVRTIWQEEIKGTSLTAALDAGKYDAPMKAIGHCLAKLHATELPMQKSVTRQERLTDARKKSHKLAQILPALADDLTAIIESAQSDLAMLPTAQKTVIHGDVHFGQFLIMPTVRWRCLISTNGHTATRRRIWPT
jgi:hypothetical protein